MFKPFISSCGFTKFSNERILVNVEVKRSLFWKRYPEHNIEHFNLVSFVISQQMLLIPVNLNIKYEYVPLKEHMYNQFLFICTSQSWLIFVIYKWEESTKQY